MKRHIFFILLIALLFSCKRSTEPLNPPKDFSSLKWSVDTLYNPALHASQTMMESIWGNSTDNVYTVGHSSGSSDMWHFNGEYWQVVPLLDYDIHCSLPGEVFGFSSDNIWAVGSRVRYNPSPPPTFLYSSVIINYDGNVWNYAMKDTSDSMLYTIWGDAPDNIWAGGDYHTLYHYDGVKWSRDSIDYDFPENDRISITEIKGHPGKCIYMIVLLYDKNGNGAGYYLFKREQDKWVMAVDRSYTVNTFANIWISPVSGSVYMGGSHLWKWDGTTLTKPVENLTVYNLYGIDDNNIFLSAMTMDWIARLYYYNGKSLHEYEELSSADVLYSGIWSDGNEVFMVGYTLGGFPNKSIVWHGK